MVIQEEDTGVALAKFANVCVIIITAAAVVAVVLGILILGKLSPLAKGVEELRAKGEANAAALAETQEFAEAAAPDYNLAVGFFAPASTKELPLTDSTGAKVGKVTNVEFRVYNVAPPAETPPTRKEAPEEEEAEEPAGEEVAPPPAPAPAPALRRAEGVSVTVTFPPDVDVATVAATGAAVQKFPGATGTLVTLDWSPGRPLHPDTYFSFRARVKPKKKGDYELKVVADANNAFAAAPSFTGKLRLTAN
jgi:hypothetical protein